MPDSAFIRNGSVALAAAVGLVLAGLSGASAQLPSNWPELGTIEADGARVSALAIDLETGRTLAQRNPSARLIPASLSKLYTAAGALRHWGPEHRFVTRLLGAEPTGDGRIDGDLVMLGGADPDLGREELRTMVAALRARGVAHVSGDLIIDESLLGRIECQTRDRCEARAQSSYAFEGPLSAAGIDYGSLEVTIRPNAKTGQEATVRLAPAHLPEPQIRGHVRTVPADGALALWLRRETPDAGPPLLHISGQIPRGHAPVKRSRSVGDAAAHTGRVLRQLLRAGGVRVSGETRVRSGADAAIGELHELARVESAPLAEQLRRMQHYSNNYMADLLTLHLAHELDGAPLALSEAADLLMEGRKSDTATETAALLDSGSGLSVSSKLSARDLVDLLVTTYDDPALFPSFLGSLPVPAFSNSGQLRGGDTLWQRRIAAKTGWLSEPVGVRAVAGYARTLSGRWIAFAIVLNGTEKRPALARRPSLSAIRQDVTSLIAAY
jgi:D-alanyl-D-alanine carboxypeptidase/D-alanyl-D-alanine-endopeptidase (penicillin-binding protein 4)